MPPLNFGMLRPSSWSKLFSVLFQSFILLGHVKSLRTFTVHNDLMYSGGYDQFIVLWNVTSGAILRTIEGTLVVFKQLVTSDGISVSSLDLKSDVLLAGQNTGQLVFISLPVGTVIKRSQCKLCKI
jgi:WD40 repeat protein